MGRLPSASLGLRRCAFALLLTASLARAQSAAETRRPGAALSAMPGVVRVALAGPRSSSAAFAASAGYGFTESVLGLGDAHHRAFGALAASVPATPWLSLGLRLDARYDLHTESNGPSQSDAVGDPRLLVRASTLHSTGLNWGAQATLWVPGQNAPSVELKATTLDLMALANYSPSRSGPTLGMQAGFRFDQSDASAPRAGELSRAHRLALELSAFNAALVGIAGVVPLNRRSELLAEVSGDILVGRGAPSVVRSPWRISFGARTRVRPNSASWLELVGEISPSARPRVDATQPLVPVEPRASLMLAFLTSLSPMRARTEPSAPGAEPRAPVLTRLAGRILGASGQPLSGARVTITDSAGRSRTTTTDANGRYEITDLLPGEFDIDIDAERHTHLHRHLRVGSGPAATLDVELERALPPGQIRGIVRDMTGKPVVAGIRIEPLGVEAASDAQGQFRIDVPPGAYDVVLKARGFVEQRRTVTVEQDGVVVLNVDLRALH